MDWILGWAAYESGAPFSQTNQVNLWGTVAQASWPDFNFFGEAKPLDHKGNLWNGEVACPGGVNVTNGDAQKFSCFNSFYDSATAALSGKYGDILRAAAGNGTTADVAFQQVANAGWAKNSNYGTLVNAITKTNGRFSVDGLIGCLTRNKYIVDGVVQ